MTLPESSGVFPMNSTLTIIKLEIVPTCSDRMEHWVILFLYWFIWYIQSIVCFNLHKPGQLAAVQKQQAEQARLLQETITPKDPPPEFEFIVDPPSISAFEL